MLINPMLSPGSSWVGQHGHPGGLVVGQSRLPVGCLLSSFTDKGDGHVTTLFSLDGSVQPLRQLLKMLDSGSHRL